MKKLLITTFVCLLVLGVFGSAKAVMLDPIVVPSSLSTGATPSSIWGIANLSLVAQRENVYFEGLDSGLKKWFSGTLDAYVYANNALGGNLLFTYQFDLDADPDPLNRIRVSMASDTDFTGFSTDVDVDVPNAWLMQRYSASSVEFMAMMGGVPESTIPVVSPLYWIQTNSLYYADGTTQLQGTGNCRITTFAPTVPEPATLSLLGLGILGLFGLRKKVA